MWIETSRRMFLRTASACVLAAAARPVFGADTVRRPNVLFAMADDWSWPHIGILGTPELRTPHCDRIAREGALFRNAYVAAPQCSPNRAALLTGRHIWQLEEAGTHGSIFPNRYPVFTDALESGGYHVGFTGKGWSPGNWERGGWTRNPAGIEYNERRHESVPTDAINSRDYAGNFTDFLADRKDTQPFFFLFGCHEPHRSYEVGSGARAGKNPANVVLPDFYPDSEIIRNDMLDYFLEIEWFDKELGRMLAILEDAGELDNTIVIVTGDNGMPFPGAKATLYDYGVRVPLAIRWPGRIAASRTIDDPIGFIDFAPTLLEAAGFAAMPSVTGRSFTNVLNAAGDGYIDPTRTAAFFGRERHTHARHDNLGYPQRGVRSGRYLYIRTMKPERWPAGDPPEYHDIDPSPTKTFLMDHREAYPNFFAHSFDKQPEEQLFDVETDTGCQRNLARDPRFVEVRRALAARLDATLDATGDPRVHGRGDIFESYPRVSRMRPELGGFAEQGEYNRAYAE